METAVDDQIAEVILKEGGYCNDPNDLGGETCWGITVAVARRFGYIGPMSALSQEVAVEIYRQQYYYGASLDRVALIAEPIARRLFDIGVNMGTGKAAEFLQIALNAFNRQAKDYPDIPEDGDIGPATLRALQMFAKHRGAEGIEVLRRAIGCLQGARYIEIARARQKNEDFVYGWIKNRVAL